MKILVINGPNLNFLGIREKSVYGNQDYEYLKNMIADKGKEIGADIENILYLIESENYKTVDSYKVFKELKLLRNMKKSKERELECCIQMTRKIDCDRLAKILENSYSKVFEVDTEEVVTTTNVA